MPTYIIVRLLSKRYTNLEQKIERNFQPVFDGYHPIKYLKCRANLTLEVQLTLDRTVPLGIGTNLFDFIQKYTD